MDKNEIALAYIDRLLFRGRRCPDIIPAYLYGLYCAIAISKRVYGNSGNYYNALKKWLPDE